MDNTSDFKAFMSHRQTVAHAYVNGDAAPLREISTRHDPASFFGPGGGAEQGAAQVLGVNEKGASSFQRGGESHLEVLHMGADGDLGYWTGFQHASALMQGQDGSVPMTLRVTEVFRREGGSWMLVHRHADMLAEKRP